MVIARQPFFTKVSKYGKIEYSGALNTSYTFQPLMSFCLYLEPLSLWFSARQSIFFYYFIFFWGGGRGGHFANTLFQIYYTAKKLTNEERDCGIQAAKLATLTFITITINVVWNSCEKRTFQEHTVW